MLELLAVEKRFGATRVLDSISLSVERGRCLCIIGPNAAGKTTLLSIAAGLLAPDGGTVHRGGRVGFVPQDAAVLGDLSVNDNLRLWYAAHEKKVRLFAPDSPEQLLGLEPYRKTRAKALSGGLRRRLAIAAALTGDPDDLLLDEPFVSLDAAACEELCALLGALKRRGLGLLLTSHDPARIAAVADEAVLLENGRLTARITPPAPGQPLRLEQVLSLLAGGTPFS
ncbi:MAG: ABC transporter ATP-binding protein [Oscillospiraceae bacterium]